MSSEWQPIESAPQDGTVVLVYVPGGVELDEHVYTWPEEARLNIVPARWHEPSDRTGEEVGWYAPFARVSFGVWDDPSTDFYQALIEPTHWMSLPSPPKENDR